MDRGGEDAKTPPLTGPAIVCSKRRRKKLVGRDVSLIREGGRPEWGERPGPIYCGGVGKCSQRGNLKKGERLTCKTAGGETFPNTEEEFIMAGRLAVEKKKKKDPVQPTSNWEKDPCRERGEGGLP